MKYIKRIIALPFFLMLNAIGMIFMLFKLSKAFILYGGEAVAYVKKDEQKTITDIYQQLQSKKSELVPYHTICVSCKNGGMCGCTLANTMVRKNYYN